MYIKRIKIEGFKTFRIFDLTLNEHLNIIVGDNETGKSSLLAAINLVMSNQLAGRNIQYELNPYIFNNSIVKEYFDAIENGGQPEPPHILIEAYLDDCKTGELAKLQGTNNSLGENCAGLYLRVDLNEDFSEDFRDYVRNHAGSKILPIEYYQPVWRSFADNSVLARTLPFRARIIDTSTMKEQYGPNKYVTGIIDDVLDAEQRILLGAAYRNLKHSFMNEDGIQEINDRLKEKKGDITKKTLTVAMDMSARSTWDSSITAHLDDIPFDSVGKGEQCRVQMKLAIESAVNSRVLLIEEPENHLSHSNMNVLLHEISQKAHDRQIILTTHSNFVLNKLGINNLKLLSRNGKTMTIGDLSPDTEQYFMKLPGYDTLRLILSEKTILVEGPSDELIVQKAYKTQHGILPLEDGVDVISVRGLSFKRFLEIGVLLGLNISVVTDNDGDVSSLEQKYSQYNDKPNIKICYDVDESCPTLEPQLVKANSCDIFNSILGTSLADKDSLVEYMQKNKTDVALKIFTSENNNLAFPEYIKNAIKR